MIDGFFIFFVYNKLFLVIPSSTLDDLNSRDTPGDVVTEPRVTRDGEL